MPRTKQARRFEPRYGVSQVAIDVEAQHLARELDDYLVYSLNDLRDKLEKRRAGWKQADERVQQLVVRLPERERLVVQCLLVRDVYHIFELYLTYLTSHEPEGTAPLNAPKPSDTPATPFSEWLFGSK
jgi:hypothetical protein